MYTCERFQSMGAYVAYVREQQKTMPHTEAITEATRAEFHGVGGSWDAAVNWAEHGDNRNLDRFAELTHQAKAKIARKVEKRFAPSFARSGAGSISMGRYMDGVPDCVVRMKPGRDQLRKGGNHERVIKIFVAINAQWQTKPEEIEKRGAYICGIIEALAAAGRKVELWVGGLSELDSGGCDFVNAVCIKKASERLHVETARYALCNPAYLRRLQFAYFDFNDALLRGANFSTVGSSGIAAVWGTPIRSSDMASEFSVVVYGMQQILDADYHIKKIEECLKTAGILH